MRKLVIGLAVATSLVFAAPAMAWTYEDCVEVDFNHPDCEQYEKPPETPPVVPPVTPPVVPPVTPPVTPPTPPVVPPTPPVVPPAPPEAPEAPPEYDIPELPERPDLPKKNEGEKGKTEKRDRGSSTPPAPQVQTRQVSATESGTLPYTGIPAGLGGLLGAGLMAGGVLMRRRVR